MNKKETNTLLSTNKRDATLLTEEFRALVDETAAFFNLKSKKDRALIFAYLVGGITQKELWAEIEKKNLPSQTTH